MLLLQISHHAYSRPARVPYHYEQQTYNRPNIYSQQSSGYRPGSSISSSSQYASVSHTQNKPGEYSSSIYSNRRPVNVSKYSNANFNRLPERPEFDETDNVDDDYDEEDDGNDGNENGSSTGQNSQYQQNPLFNFHKKKRPGLICVPQSHGNFGGGLFPFKGWGFGGLNGLGFGSLLRNEPISGKTESRAGGRPPEDPRTIFKLQNNLYNYYGGNPSVYKPSSGYPCKPVNFYGSRPGGFGQFGQFDFGNNRPGGGGGGLFSDTPTRPGALGILSDTVKPVFESTAIQDGVGAAVSFI